MPSLDDFEQNHELMEAGENLAQELVELIRQTYPDKCMRFKATLGGPDREWRGQRVADALLFQIKELIKEDNTGKNLFIPEECREMIEDIFSLIRDNYGDNPGKLKDYISVLSDWDGMHEFISDLGPFSRLY